MLTWPCLRMAPAYGRDFLLSSIRTLRRISILFTMLAERIVLGYKHSVQVQLSVLLMAIGTGSHS